MKKPLRFLTMFVAPVVAELPKNYGPHFLSLTILTLCAFKMAISVLRKRYASKNYYGRRSPLKTEFHASWLSMVLKKVHIRNTQNNEKMCDAGISRRQRKLLTYLLMLRKNKRAKQWPLLNPSFIISSYILEFLGQNTHGSWKSWSKTLMFRLFIWRGVIDEIYWAAQQSTLFSQQLTFLGQRQCRKDRQTLKLTPFWDKSMILLDLTIPFFPCNEREAGNNQLC